MPRASNEIRDRDIVFTMRTIDPSDRAWHRKVLAEKYNITTSRVDQIWYEKKDHFRDRQAPTSSPPMVPTSSAKVQVNTTRAHAAKRQTVYITLMPESMSKHDKKEIAVTGDIEELFQRIKQVAQSPLDRLRDAMENNEISERDAESLLHTLAVFSSKGETNGSVGVSRTTESSRIQTRKENTSATPRTAPPEFEDHTTERTRPDPRRSVEAPEASPEDFRNAGHWGGAT